MADRPADISSSPGSEPGGDVSEEKGLSRVELEAEDGAALPDPEAMPLVSANVNIPANPAIAADVLAGELDVLEPADGHEGDDG